MIFRRVYRFKLEPNTLQTQRLYQLAGARRFVFNWALARRKECFEQTRKSLSVAALCLELTQLKKQEERFWLGESDSQVLQQAVKDCDKAFQNFFAGRSKFPRFASRNKGHFAFRIPQRVKVEAGNVYCPKIGWMKIRQSQEVEGKAKSATFKRDACGDWFVTLTVEFEREVKVMETPENPVGLDMGLKDFVTLSTGTLSIGETVAAPRFYRALQKKLGQAQRKLCRAQKGSHRRLKAKLKVAKVHRKIANSRADFLHKLTSGLVAKFDHIGIEDLNLTALAKTKLKGHVKSWNDAAFGEFCRQLEYKCEWSGVRLTRIGRFFPSSKLCGACGLVNQKLTLSDRVWVCDCGKVHHRDLNASLNILRESLKLALGQRDNQNAQGRNVRPSLKAVPVELRIPCL